MNAITKKIDGVNIKFRITLQPKYRADRNENYWLKIIDVSDGVGTSPAANWIDAIEMARHLAAATNQWHINTRAKRAA